MTTFNWHFVVIFVINFIYLRQFQINVHLKHFYKKLRRHITYIVKLTCEEFGSSLAFQQALCHHLHQ